MPERKRLLDRARRRWEDIIRMDLREIGWDGSDWMHPGQDKEHWRAVCEQGNEPPGSIS